MAHRRDGRQADASLPARRRRAAGASRRRPERQAESRRHSRVSLGLALRLPESTVSNRWTRNDVMGSRTRCSVAALALLGCSSGYCAGTFVYVSNQDDGDISIYTLQTEGG